MSTLLAILATTRRTPSWAAFSLLFVLTLFTAAVVSLNVPFHRKAWWIPREPGQAPRKTEENPVEDLRTSQ
jgi:hypothetical protein